MNSQFRCAVICASFLLFGALPYAQQSPASKAEKPVVDPAPSAAAADLQKAVQNPVASLISVPVQNNSNFSVGDYDRTQNVLNIQPVIPGKLTENWNYIARIIQPIIWQPYPSQTTGGEFGFGDMNPTFFISPSKPGKLIWGAGPAFVIPTATNDILGQGKFSIGPSFVALTQPGHWTLGGLINNVWSVAGSGGRPDVNQMLFQYFVNYNLKKGYYISVSPILTANWEAASGDVWTVPFGGGIGRIMKMGYQPVNVTAQFYANPIRPSGASSWGMRLQLAFLFPKLTEKQKMMMMEMKLKEMQEQEQHPAPAKK